MVSLSRNGTGWGYVNSSSFVKKDSKIFDF
jgi:hypothetical protein